MGCVEFTPIPGNPTKRAMDIYDRCFKKGLFVRPTGSSIAIAPPLIVEKAHLDTIFNVLADCIVESDKELV